MKKKLKKVKVRKPIAPPQKVHKDKSKYDRKEKHKNKNQWHEGKEYELHADGIKEVNNE